jgi:hypothetical protein
MEYNRMEQRTANSESPTFLRLGLLFKVRMENIARALELAIQIPQR